MSPTLDPPDARDLRARLARHLAVTGAIESPQWREAFERVPRHALVPAFTRRTPAGRLEVIDEGRRRVWLQAVYADDSLVIRRGPDGTATSSSSQPSVMAAMLEALKVRTGLTVLEVGTGTGYTAALLCQRLGSEHVANVDVEPELVQDARERLALLGYHPAVTTGNGQNGWPDHSPYDRLIATCGTRRIPVSWLEQTRPNGVIVASIGRGLIGLRRDIDGGAHGRFLPMTASFTPAHTAGEKDSSATEAMGVVAVGDNGTERGTDVFDVLHDLDFAVVVTLFLPGIRHFWTPELYTIVDPLTGSWARAEKAPATGTVTATVTQRGTRELWTEVEAAHRHWMTAGRPAHHRYGLHVTAEGRHTLWVDELGRHPIRMPTPSSGRPTVNAAV